MLPLTSQWHIFKVYSFRASYLESVEGVFLALGTDVVDKLRCSVLALIEW